MLLVSAYFFKTQIFAGIFLYMVTYLTSGVLPNTRISQNFVFVRSLFVNILNGFPPPPLKSQMIRFQTVRDWTLT